MKYFRRGHTPTYSTQEIKTEETEDFLPQEVPPEATGELQTRGEGGEEGQEGEKGRHRQAGEDLGLRRYPLRDWLKLQWGPQSKEVGFNKGLVKILGSV